MHVADDDSSGKSGSLVSINVDLGKLDRVAGHAAKVLNNAIHAIESGCGSAWAPLAKVLHAKANQKVLSIRAQTLIDLEKKRQELNALANLKPDHQKTVVSTALDQLIEGAIVKQFNREKVVEELVSDLVSDPPKTDADKEIDDDWLTKYWGFAEQVGKPQVQRFYARLLASEVRAPGTISYLTLGTLSALDPRIAQLFQHFCNLSIDTGSDVFVIHPRVHAFQQIGPLDDFGVQFETLFELEAHGLIRSVEALKRQYSDESNIVHADYAGLPIVFDYAGLQLDEITFTRSGRELRRILSLSPNPAYTKALAKILNYQVTGVPADLRGL